MTEPVRKYEYQIVEYLDSEDAVLAELNAAGAEGWRVMEFMGKNPNTLARRVLMEREELLEAVVDTDATGRTLYRGVTFRGVASIEAVEGD